jgi:hypothetical protein
MRKNRQTSVARARIAAFCGHLAETRTRAAAGKFELYVRLKPDPVARGLE